MWKFSYPAEYVKAFKGRAPELLRHPAGTHVLDDLYCAANLEQRRMMAAEFYGKEYALFENGTLNNTRGAPDTLSGLLSVVDGQKQLSIIKHFASSITPVIEKGLVDNQLAHKLIMEYLKSAPISLVEDAIETLSGDHLMHMIHTHEGAEAACMIIAYGSAKDRKKSIRAFKGHVEAALRDEWGYLPVATALSVTDDTSLLKKVIITDIQVCLCFGAKRIRSYCYMIEIKRCHPMKTSYRRADRVFALMSVDHEHSFPSGRLCV